MSYRSVLVTEEDPCVRQENSDAGLVGKELKKKNSLFRMGFIGQCAS